MEGIIGNDRSRVSDPSGRRLAAAMRQVRGQQIS